MGERISENAVGMSREELKEILVAVINASKEKSPLEKKAALKELERERRSQIMHISQGYAEEMSRWNHQHGCSHSRDKTTGDPVPKGTGVWTTGGQYHSGPDGMTATLVCLRCSTNWKFRITEQEREYIENRGMMGMQPPPIERCTNKEEFLRNRPEDPQPKILELQKAWQEERL